MSATSGFRQWLFTIFLVLLTLFVMSYTVKAESIYNISGDFAPALANQNSSPFAGQVLFPGETVSEGLLSLTIGDEVRDVPFSLALNLPATPLQPWDTRMFVGTFNDSPVLMNLVDWDRQAGASFDAAGLEDGGGWDVWSISFSDWPAGSIATMNAVAEPTASLSLLIGFITLAGAMMLRR